MPTNPQGSTVVPCLLYRDAAKMIDWLCEVIGFEQKAVYYGENNKVLHGELSLGAGMIMLGSTADEDESSPWAKLTRQPDELNYVETQSPSIYSADPDAIYQAVIAKGGSIVLEIEDKNYGGRGFSFRDPEGHLWTVGSYDPWAS